jgi:hypothetical protein
VNDVKRIDASSSQSDRDYQLVNRICPYQIGPTPLRHQSVSHDGPESSRLRAGIGAMEWGTRYNVRNPPLHGLPLLFDAGVH